MPEPSQQDDFVRLATFRINVETSDQRTAESGVDPTDYDDYSANYYASTSNFDYAASPGGAADNTNPPLNSSFVEPATTFDSLISDSHFMKIIEPFYVLLTKTEQDELTPAKKVEQILNGTVYCWSPKYKMG